MVFVGSKPRTNILTIRHYRGHHRDHPGRIHMLSVSSGRSVVNAWITSLSSASVTCAACCRAISNIIMTRERISRSTRIVHGIVPYSYPSQAITLLPSRRSAACIIAMSVEPRKMGEVGAACPYLNRRAKLNFEQRHRSGGNVTSESNLNLPYRRSPARRKSKFSTMLPA